MRNITPIKLKSILQEKLHKRKMLIALKNNMYLQQNTSYKNMNILQAQCLFKVQQKICKILFNIQTTSKAFERENSSCCILPQATLCTYTFKR